MERGSKGGLRELSHRKFRSRKFRSRKFRSRKFRSRNLRPRELRRGVKRALKGCGSRERVEPGVRRIAPRGSRPPRHAERAETRRPGVIHIYIYIRGGESGVVN